MRWRWLMLNKGDPWRRRPNPSGEPPNLDEIFKRLFSKVKARSGSGGSPQRPSIQLPWIRVTLVMVLLLWLVSGIFVVKQAERGVILRFGRYVHTVGPGLHWIPTLIEQRIIKNVEQVSQFSYQALMLTKDENIVSVEVAVQYRIADLRDYLFSVRQPVLSINEATASALRYVVGHTPLDDLLTTGREQVRDQVMQQLKMIMKLYNTGLLVTKVSLQPAKPPEEVTEAFNDAIKAREDEQRYINQANAYSSKVLPIAQGNAARQKQAAEANAKQLVLLAKGTTAQFLALLPEYRLHPQVLRQRLYIKTIQSVLSHSTKVLVDLKGQNVFYLPFDKLMRRAGQPAMNNPNSDESLRETVGGDESLKSSEALADLDSGGAYSARARYSQSSRYRDGR